MLLSFGEKVEMHHIAVDERLLLSPGPTLELTNRSPEMLARPCMTGASLEIALKFSGFGVFVQWEENKGDGDDLEEVYPTTGR